MFFAEIENYNPSIMDLTSVKWLPGTSKLPAGSATLSRFQQVQLSLYQLLERKMQSLQFG